MSSHPCCFAPDHIADVHSHVLVRASVSYSDSQMSDDHVMCELNDKLSRTSPRAEKASLVAEPQLRFPRPVFSQFTCTQ